MERLDWHNYFMNMAYLIASRSKDQNTHIGAVVVNDDHIVLATGFNSFVRGANDDVPERQVAPEKYYHFEHAERNAIYSAAREGVRLKDCTMYTQGTPCMDCARGIVQAGIRRVYVDGEWTLGNPIQWAKHAERTVQLFKETGVELLSLDVKRPLVTIGSFRRGAPISADVSHNKC